MDKFADVLETYYLDESKTMPTSYWAATGEASGYLGQAFERYSGGGVMNPPTP